MAAAEYYSNAPMEPQYQQSPYQRPPQPHMSSPNPQYAVPSQHQQRPPPPYTADTPEHKPTVHFADSQRPQRPHKPHRQSFSSQAPIPVLADQERRSSTSKPPFSPRPSMSTPQPAPSPYLQPQSRLFQPQSQHQPQYSSQPRPQPQPQPPRHQIQHLSPYTHLNQSQPVLTGYASDPEHHRRRRRRHSNDHRESRRNDRDLREEKSRKDRSRSTNADGLLGAAGGGLIGDLIFPGLGTVGGAVAGWIGGKDYGKHRKYREDKLDRDQERWEHKFRRHSDEKGHSLRDREQRSHERHKHDY